MKKEERRLYNLIVFAESELAPEIGLPEPRTGSLDLLSEALYAKSGLIRNVKAAWLKLKRKYPESGLIEYAEAEIDYLSLGKYAFHFGIL